MHAGTPHSTVTTPIVQTLWKDRRIVARLSSSPKRPRMAASTRRIDGMETALDGVRDADR